MSAMSLSNLHPDLKLGLLLVGAVLFLDAGSSVAFRALLVSDRLDLSDLQYGLITAVSAVGSLSVVGAAIWVDLRLPHLMMVAGAVALALGMALVTVADGFVLAASGMFLSGVGGAFTGSLIFYSLAVKGYVRFRGTLLGALALAFSVRLHDLAFALGWGDWATTDQLTSQSTLWWPLGLTLGAGVLLFLLLPRCFQGSYGAWPQPQGDRGCFGRQGPDSLVRGRLRGGGDGPGRRVVPPPVGRHDGRAGFQGT